MLQMNELLHGADLAAQSKEIQDNLAVLLDRVNKIRAEWGKPMTVTSGLRTMADHIRIYEEKAAAAGVPFDKSKVPMASKHLIGAAVDIYDPDLSLTVYLKDNNSQRLIDAELWCEQGNANWVHFQIYAPKSGNRWFLP
jgi:uncharacterized protein YcbK (DUF882 family)